MLDRPAIAELLAIAARSADAAESNTRALVDAYEDLRTRATTLARAQEWATPEDQALDRQIEGDG
jgi:hypothetical protein